MATTYTRKTYTRSDRANQAQKQLDDHLATRPMPYTSAWLSQLDRLTNELLNRESFSYDPGTDPLYRETQSNYVNLGRQAMEDTQGQAAALTGGYGSSYGLMAGQQVYNNYLTQLSQQIPELYQLALDAYDRQGRILTDRYGLLSDRENLDYSRYQDGLAGWADTRDYLAGRLDNENTFDYTHFRDEVSDDQWQAAFDEDIRRFDFENKLGEFALEGGTGSSGGGSGGGGTRRKKKKTEDTKEEKKPASTSKGPYVHISVPHRTNPHLTDENF